MIKKTLSLILITFFMFGSLFVLSEKALGAGLYQKKVLVIAPHEDDEIIGCAGVIKRYVDIGADIRVMYVTNGDVANLQRERILESISALNMLGLVQNKIIYLGYGDATAMDLYNSKSNPDAVYPSNFNSQTTSFPDIGVNTYHYSKYGSEAAYTRRNISNDIYNALFDFQPDEIIMPAQMEGHTDHAATALFVIEAILNLKRSISYQPTILEYMIYAFNIDLGLWLPPLECDPTVAVSNAELDIDNYAPYPWNERVSIPVDAQMTTSFTPAWPGGEPVLPSDNLKYNAIHQFETQNGGYWLYEPHIRKDEVFWKRQMSSLSYSSTVTASSEYTARNQVGNNVIDGVFIGELITPFDGNNATFQNFEWATNGQGSGAWIQLNWQQPVTANQIKLYDRPNFNDNILSGRLQFSDGTTIMVGKLNKNGAATTINFPVKTFSWVKFTMDTLQGSNPGLSEFEVYDTTENIASKAVLTASTQTTAYSQLTFKAVDGVVSGFPVDYSKEWATTGETTGAWIQLDWPQEYIITKVVLHDRINADDHITAGKLTYSDGTFLNTGSLPNDGTGYEVSTASKITKSLRFEITGFAGYNAGLAEIEVYGYPLKLNRDYYNIAPDARVSASSQLSGYYTAVKAVDGVRSGYPCDYANEWATNGQLNGAWLQLDWERTYHIKRVVLYDRPNPDDHITAGRLSFDDGTNLTVGSLPNDGTGYIVDIPGGKNVKWVKFEVTGAVGYDTGLAEIEVLGCPGGKINITGLSPTITSTPVRSGAVGNCFDELDETTYVSQDPGSLSINEEPCFVQLAFANPVSISTIRTLIGEPGYNHIKFDWWIEAANTATDLNNKTGTYVKVGGDTRYDISGYWDTISLYNSPISKKIWKFWVKKKTYDDFSTISELELWSE